MHRITQKNAPLIVSFFLEGVVTHFMYKEEENIDSNKENLRSKIGKLTNKYKDSKEGEISKESVIEAVNFLFERLNNQTPIDGDDIGAFEHICEYIESKNSKLLNEFTNSKFITIIIKMMKFDINAASLALTVINDLWFMNNDKGKLVLYDEELIDEVLELVFNDEFTEKSFIISALTNCIYTSSEAAEHIIENIRFIDCFKESFKTSDFSLLIPSLKLLICFVLSGCGEHFRELFDFCLELTSNYIARTAETAMRVIYAFIEHDTDFVLAKPIDALLEKVINGMDLGYTVSIEYGFQVLSKIMNFCSKKLEKGETVNYEPIKTDKMLSIISCALGKLTQDDASNVLGFMVQANPIMWDAFWATGIIGQMMENICDLSFRNKPPTISYLCDFFTMCPDIEAKSTMANDLLQLIVDNIACDDNPSVLRWLCVVDDITSKLDDFDAEAVCDVLDNLCENDDDSIKVFAEKILDKIRGDDDDGD